MSQTQTPNASQNGWIGPVSAGTFLILIGVAGYFLYLHAGTLFEQGQTLPPLLILGLALIGGAASFFSPCGIAITPAFLTYLSVGEPPAKDAPVLSRSLVVSAGMVALGIVVFYSIAGLVIGTVGNIAYNYLIYFIPVVGTVFILLGVMMILGRSGMLSFVQRWNPMNRQYARGETQPVSGGNSGKRMLFSFGFAYGAASHTCSLPIFLGVLLLPLVAGNYLLAMLSVFLYGFAIALLVVVMMLLGQRFFVTLRRTGARLMQVTAVLFIGTGGFLFYYFVQNYGIYANPTPSAPVAAVEPGARYTLTIGADKTGYPYQPRKLIIPAGKTVDVAVTDHVGGCLLKTIFEGLGAEGQAAEVTVPVGETRVVQLYAPHPGSYNFHCSVDMYSGTVEAK
jgi:cytochrome c-type biogenesis protein